MALHFTVSLLPLTASMYLRIGQFRQMLRAQKEKTLVRLVTKLTLMD